MIISLLKKALEALWRFSYTPLCYALCNAVCYYILLVVLRYCLQSGVLYALFSSIISIRFLCAKYANKEGTTSSRYRKIQDMEQ
jgi:hypothetical protein